MNIKSYYKNKILNLLKPQVWVILHNNIYVLTKKKQYILDFSS